MTGRARPGLRSASQPGCAGWVHPACSRRVNLHHPSSAEGQAAGRCQSGSRSDRFDRQRRLSACRFAKARSNSLAELIALAKKEPHKIIIGTNPAGSLPHLAARLLVELSKAPFTVLPYATGGTNEAIRDILGGRVHAVIETRSGLKGALDSGDLKALAIMSGERHEKFPDLPAAAETVPGLTAVGWQALVAPKGTPEAIIDQLREDLFKALQDAHLQTHYEQMGTSFRPMPAADLIRFIEAEQKLWWPIVKGAGPK